LLRADGLVTSTYVPALEGYVRVYYLLSGRVSCECGYKMAGNSAKRTRKDGSSVRTGYYRCKGKSNRYALKPYDTKGVPADKLEKIVYRWVEKVISDQHPGEH
jgi:hypothetical protein